VINRRAIFAFAFFCVIALAGPAQARAQYPYTLIDPGTFGGSSSGPSVGIELTPNGVLLGSADTTIPDSDSPSSNPFVAPDPDLTHAFAWRAGRLEDLGALPGNNSSAIVEMNGNGLGVGASETSVVDPFTGSPAIHAVTFKDGRVQDLGTLPGGTESLASAVNSSGQVAGVSLSGPPDPLFQFPTIGLPMGSPLRAFIWQDGVMRDLGTLGGPDATVANLNAQGQIAGSSETDSTPNSSTGLATIHPFVWQNGHMRDLGTLGGTLATAAWMNDAGEVVGTSSLAGDNTADPFLWTGTKMIDLGGFGGGYGQAMWINGQGDVTGFSSTTAGNADGFLWRDGKLIDLPPVPGTVDAFPQSVNNLDQVVGETDVSPNTPIIAALWTGGRTYDLNTLIAPSSLQLVSAGYIDEKGDIVGFGILPDGSQREYLLIRNPTAPLPATSNAARAQGTATLSGSGLLLHRLPYRGGLPSIGIRRIPLDRMR
jgi:probable HAF family extracellular repeat protein